ncbi:MAG: hypothetical protein HY077_18905 [Elusimicrobia bacterium]|nr:hypothetical protein [Elusimicrobiota bacterium]
MEQQHLVKLLEERVSVVTDGARALHARAEDFAFRAQHVANALKNGFPVRDRAFGDDLQVFNKHVKTFGGEALDLPNLLARLERAAHYEEETVRSAQSLFRAVSTLTKEMRNLQAAMGVAHQYIRNTTFKVESTYICLELEKITQKTDLLPQSCNKILLAIATPTRVPG